jgi:hypothetical protein
MNYQKPEHLVQVFFSVVAEWRPVVDDSQTRIEINEMIIALSSISKYGLHLSNSNI